MTYVFQCEVCGKRQEAVRSVADRDEAPLCRHSTEHAAYKTRRVYDFSTLQLCTQRVADQDANKMPWLDSIDRKRNREQSEREYARNWARTCDDPEVSQRADGTRMRDLYGKPK